MLKTEHLRLLDLDDEWAYVRMMGVFEPLRGAVPTAPGVFRASRDLAHEQRWVPGSGGVLWVELYAGERKDMWLLESLNGRGCYSVKRRT